MASIKHQRRQFIRAVGASATALPFFDLLRSSAVQGQGSGDPLRLVTLYTSHGGDWIYTRPKGVNVSKRGVSSPIDAESLKFEHSVLEPLAKHVSRMMVLEGVGMTEGLLRGGGNDPTQARTLFVGHEHTAGNAFTGSRIEWQGEEAYPLGPSLEYELGQQLGGDTAVRSIQLGLAAATHSHVGCVSFNESGQRLPGIGEPRESFRQLFGDNFAVSEGDTGPDLELRNNLRVVDALQKSAERLRGRLAGPERAKLDEHLSAMADIESRLEAQSKAVIPISCGEPSAPPEKVTDFQEVSQLQLDVLAQALACNRTRFVGMSWGSSISKMEFLHGNEVADLHSDVAHAVDVRDTSDEYTPDSLKASQHMAQVNRWYATQLAQFMDRLDSIQEGDGTVLDNTLIVWAQDFGPQVHGGLNVPYILLGGGATQFKMGRHLHISDPVDPNERQWPQLTRVERSTPNNHLMISILNEFGIETDKFNSEEFTGPLSDLT